MLAARRMIDADEWIARAERLARPDIVTRVTVPTLRAWHEWMFGRLDVAVEMIDAAARWMADHRVGAHHLAFDTLITAGWCRLSAGDLADAVRFAERASADAETLGYAWNQLQAGFLTAAPRARHRGSGPAPSTSSTTCAPSSPSRPAGRTPIGCSAWRSRRWPPAGAPSMPIT